MNYGKLVSKSKIPQTAPLDKRQVANNAGGFVYAIDCWSRLDRFLVLGSDKPTFYQDAPKLTRENAESIVECFDTDPGRAIDRIVEISVDGRAPKNDPAIFAIALATTHKDVRVRTLAYAAIDKVCRTATHLFQLISVSKELGKGFGRGFKRAIANWYDEKPVDKVAYQAVKYRNRENRTHRNVLDMAHPEGDGNSERNALYAWLTPGPKKVAPAVETLPRIVQGHLLAMELDQAPELESRLITLIRDYNLPWEAIPTWAARSAAVQKSLLPDMPLHALTRQLGRLANLEVTKPLSDGEALVALKFSDAVQIRKSKLHPFAILQALAVYKGGEALRAGRGDGMKWKPSQLVMDALDNAFYKAFLNVESTGKRFYIGLDVSGSMGEPMNGSPLTVREAAAAMAMVTMKVEPRTYIAGFSAGGRRGFGGYHGQTKMEELDFTSGSRLTDVVRKVTDVPFGRTDCSLPMLHALENGIEADVFMILTDNETYAGEMHPMEALRKYRKETKIDAKLIVVGMTSTGFSIADPADGGCLDVVGFDASAPAVISQFVKG